MPKPKKLPLAADQEQLLVTYEEALTLFQAAGLCSEIRTVRTHIWANPDICPVVKNGYHFRRVHRGDVERLIALIAAKYPNRRLRVNAE